MSDATPPSHNSAIARAVDTLDSGRFEADLARRISSPSVSRENDHKADLERYLTDEMIPPKARARLQLQHPVGVCQADVKPAIQRTLDAPRFERVRVVSRDDAAFPASRSDLDGPWVRFVAASMERSLGHASVLLPNLGGSLPNAIFTDTLGLPTIWVPYSYPGCDQHGADEHLPIAIIREGLALMTGILWDLGETAYP